MVATTTSDSGWQFDLRFASMLFRAVVWRSANSTKHSQSLRNHTIKQGMHDINAEIITNMVPWVIVKLTLTSYTLTYKAVFPVSVSSDTSISDPARVIRWIHFSKNIVWISSRVAEQSVQKRSDIIIRLPAINNIYIYISNGVSGSENRWDWQCYESSCERLWWGV